MTGISTPKRPLAAVLIGLTLSAPVAALAAAPPTGPDGRPPAPAAAPPGPDPALAPPKAGAPIDLTGQWVAIVNEDWRWRMVTPPKGDFPGIPLNEAGRKAAEAWDPATDGSCKAYGVAGLYRNPTRLRISWVGEDQIKVETDAGVQTRILVFDKQPDASTPRTLQGFSAARWQRPVVVPAPVAGGVQVGNAFRPPGGTLMVVTTHTTGGWLRKNGVPYSQDARVSEYYDRFKGPDGSEWLTVLTQVDDPANLNGPFITSTHFKRENNTTTWRPKPCRAG